MTSRILGRAVLVVSLLVALFAYADTPPPAAPTFDGWTMKADLVAAPAQIDALSKKLGGKIAAVRNTVYDVKGNRVQVNLMVATDPAQADKLAAAMGKLKPAWSFVRKGTTIYEFVGGNEMIGEIKKVSAKLAGS